MKKMMLSMMLMGVLGGGGVAHAEKVFDSAGNLLKDTDSVGTAINPGWSEKVNRNIEVLEGLKRQTPEYQDGYYARVEEAKREKERAIAYAAARAEAQKEAFDREIKIRGVLAQESQARAQHSNASANWSQAAAMWSRW